MAHRTGYTGSVTDTSGTDLSWMNFITRWSLDYASRTNEVNVQGENVPTLSVGILQWVATIEFLVPSGLGVNDLDVNDDVTIKLLFDDDGNDFFSGNGKIVEYAINDPRDGPVTGTATIQGNGDLSLAT